jgi:hypothetical protein
MVGATVISAGFEDSYWWQERTQDEKEGPTGMIVGSLLALMAFLPAAELRVSCDCLIRKVTL